MTVTMIKHLILLRIDFYDFISQLFFFLVFVSAEKTVFVHICENTSMLVKNTPLRVVFSIHFSVFRVLQSPSRSFVFDRLITRIPRLKVVKF